MSQRKINDKGLSLIKSFEGLQLMAYRDLAGVWTIGYGHTGSDVSPTQKISLEQANMLLLNDLDMFEHGVSKFVTVPVNDNQFSALVSFVYNIGLGSFEKSTLLKLLNLKQYEPSAEQFLRWDKVGGKEIPGLLRRREAERKLFLS